MTTRTWRRDEQALTRWRVKVLDAVGGVGYCRHWHFSWESADRCRVVLFMDGHATELVPPRRLTW